MHLGQRCGCGVWDPPTSVQTLCCCCRKPKQPASLPGWGAPSTGSAPSSAEGHSPSPTDSPRQAQCQLPCPQSSPERQVPVLRGGPLEGAVLPAALAGLCSAACSCPNTREGSGAEAGLQSARKSLDQLSKGPQSKYGPQSCPMSAGTGQTLVPASLARSLARSPDAASREGRGLRSAGAHGGQLHPDITRQQILPRREFWERQAHRQHTRITLTLQVRKQ